MPVHSLPFNARSHSVPQPNTVYPLRYIVSPPGIKEGNPHWSGGV